VFSSVDSPVPVVCRSEATSEVGSGPLVSDVAVTPSSQPRLDVKESHGLVDPPSSVVAAAIGALQALGLGDWAAVAAGGTWRSLLASLQQCIVNSHDSGKLRQACTAVLAVMYENRRSLEIQQVGVRALLGLPWKIMSPGQVSLAVLLGVSVLRASGATFDVVVGLTCQLFHALCGVSREARSAVMFHDGLEPLCGLLVDDKVACGTVALVCGVIGVCTANTPLVQKAFVSSNGLERLFVAMGRHLQSAAVQAAGCTVVANVTFVDRNAEVVLARGGIQALLGAADAHPKNAAVIIPACRALYRLGAPAQGGASAWAKLKLLLAHLPAALPADITACYGIAVATSSAEDPEAYG
jgi:hypothetical protein